jgi:hypothetical protein
VLFWLSLLAFLPSFPSLLPKPLHAWAYLCLPASSYYLPLPTSLLASLNSHVHISLPYSLPAHLPTSASSCFCAFVCVAALYLPLSLDVCTVPPAILCLSACLFFPAHNPFPPCLTACLPRSLALPLPATAFIVPTCQCEWLLSYLTCLPLSACFCLPTPLCLAACLPAFQFLPLPPCLRMHPCLSMPACLSAYLPSSIFPYISLSLCLPTLPCIPLPRMSLPTSTHPGILDCLPFSVSVSLFLCDCLDPSAPDCPSFCGSASLPLPAPSTCLPACSLIFVCLMMA